MNNEKIESNIEQYGLMIFISDREKFNINLKYERYGENYKEIIQKKWDMRKISKNLGIKNKTEKRSKI